MSAQEKVFEAQHAARLADNAWQLALDAAGIQRYSREAQGATGSLLRKMYDAKINADRRVYKLTRQMRSEEV